eukprot:6560-Heterococcus_DN1.PRE.2
MHRAPREEELPAVAQLQGYGLGIEEAVMSLRNTEHALAAKLAEVACADSSAHNTSSSSSSSSSSSNKRASSGSHSSSSSARNSSSSSSSSSTKKSRKGNRSSTAAAAAQDSSEYEDYCPDCEQSCSECECGVANGYDNGNSDNGSLDIQVALALAWALEV